MSPIRSTLQVPTGSVPRVHTYGMVDSPQPEPAEVGWTKQAPPPAEGDIRPSYYATDTSYEPWKVMRATMTAQEYRGYLKGTALAYLLRGQGHATSRSNPIQDAAKAATVLNELRRFDQETEANRHE